MHPTVFWRRCNLHGDRNPCNSESFIDPFIAVFLSQKELHVQTGDFNKNEYHPFIHGSKKQGMFLNFLRFQRVNPRQPRLAKEMRRQATQFTISANRLTTVPLAQKPHCRGFPKCFCNSTPRNNENNTLSLWMAVGFLGPTFCSQISRHKFEAIVRDFSSTIAFIFSVWNLQIYRESAVNSGNRATVLPFCRLKELKEGIPHRWSERHLHTANNHPNRKFQPHS